MNETIRHAIFAGTSEIVGYRERELVPEICEKFRLGRYTKG
jgi:hypothetical protein